MILGQYFDKQSNRYKHISGAVSLMKSLTKKLRLLLKMRIMAVKAMLLHDIGYSDKVSRSNFNPYDGYMLCVKNEINPAVAKAVLLHSGAFDEWQHRIEAETYPRAHFAQPISVPLDFAHPS